MGEHSSRFHREIIRPSAEELLNSKNGEIMETRSAIQIFNYITFRCHEGNTIIGQPVSQLYYHRPISELLEQSFKAGFVVKGTKEPVFSSDKIEWMEIPPVIIIRLKK